MLKGEHSKNLPIFVPSLQKSLLKENLFKKKKEL